jgi:FG-GAP-like repeat/FG-GAP repeat
MRRSACHFMLAFAVLLLAACGGGGGGAGGGGGNGPPGVNLAAVLAAPASVLPGESYDYGVTVAATGGAAQHVAATLTLPDSVMIGVISDGGAANGHVVSWPVAASLAAGNSLNFTVSVVAPSVGPLAARLEATTDTAESGAADNVDTARTVLGFEALATLRGEAAGDGFGFVADEIGDITGDGVPDFIVGAPGNDAAGAEAGRAYVYSGAGSALVYTISGHGAGEQAGWSVAGAGDVDGDGTADFAVGSPNMAGLVRVYSGADGGLLLDLSGPAPGSMFGKVIAGIGDINGDGRGDLLIGAEGAAGGAGQAVVVSGMNGATLRTHASPGISSYGFGVGALGDVSGDGVPDYGIGGGVGPSGRVEARSGADGSLLYTVSAIASSVQLGFIWIDAVGDVDQDSIPDFFVADIDDSSNRGRGFLISGADGATIRTFRGEQSAEFFGIARHAGQDTDGDGIPDLFIAGYHNGEGAANGGKAYVYSGANGDLLRTMTSTVSNETLGYDAVQLGDVDGDGLVDYLLTGDIETGSTLRGVAYVIRGTPLP